ncbi:MAG: nucleotidyltransferase family protein [Oscillospiraceae bacterium]|jgi:hypothetical protein|nr:nucleotidyltransferase family protein [Oscillospiraceae bacterium]
MKNLLITAAVLALSLAAACGSGSSSRAIEEFNASCTFPYKLAETGGAFAQDSDYEFSPGFGCEFYTSLSARITRSGYPDIMDDLHITAIELSSWEYSVFDFCVGDQMDKADRLLKKRGYKTESAEDARYMVYTKGGVELELTRSISDDCMSYNTIARIIVSVETTNKQNVLF